MDEKTCGAPGGAGCGADPEELRDVLHDPWPGRLEKPRSSGLTMVIDLGLGLDGMRDVLRLAAPYVDFWKLAFGSALLYPAGLVRAKVALAAEVGVEAYAGGTLLEIARWQERLGGALRALERLGVRTVELSDGTLPLGPHVRRGLIRVLSQEGFRVLTEAGKKHPDDHPGIDALAETVAADLEAGAFKVIVEGRESGRNAAVLAADGSVAMAAVRTLVDAAGDPDRLIWEAPDRAQQLVFLRAFGANANLGNVRPGDVLTLESLRRGLRGDTFRDVLRRGARPAAPAT